MSKLDTKNLKLRVRSLTDADDLLRVFQAVRAVQPSWDPRSAAGLRMADPSNLQVPDRDWIVKSVFLSDTHWRKNGFGYWSVFINNTLIGSVGLKRNAERTVFLEVEIHPDYQKKGYAKEAASAAIDYGFRLHKIPAIFGTVKSLNTAAIKLMKSLGFEESSADAHDLTLCLKCPTKR